MSSKLVSGDMTVISVDSNDLLTLVKNVKMVLTGMDDDASPIIRVYKSAQVVKKTAKLSASVMTANSAPIKRSNLDVSSWSLAGTDFIAELLDGDIDIQWNLVRTDGVKDAWTDSQCTKKEIILKCQLMVSATEATAQLLPMKFNSSSAVSGLMSLAVDAGFNGGNVTFTSTLVELEHAFDDAEKQIYNATFKCQGSDSGTYPSAPSGSTTLLEKAINTLAAYAFTLTSHASAGNTYSGNIILSSLRCPLANGQIQRFDYNWVNSGAITIANT